MRLRLPMQRYGNPRVLACGFLLSLFITDYSTAGPSAANYSSMQPPGVAGMVEREFLSQEEITVEGTTSGTVTDLEGLYSITVPDGAVLVFSFIGFEQIRVVADRAEINLTLRADISSLDEVVVVGYGTQKRANLTGAVDQISSEVFQNRPVSNLNQGLQGLMPNVNIRPMDGNPSGAPAINIRGTNSIGAGGNALVLIDGVEGDASMVNPNDIESISVLKDAASASIYGARGAFGVVLITTKKAPKDRTQITYSTNYSVKKPTTTFNHVTDGYTFAKMFNEAHLGRTDYATPPLGINK